MLWRGCLVLADLLSRVNLFLTIFYLHSIFVLFLFLRSVDYLQVSLSFDKSLLLFSISFRILLIYRFFLGAITTFWVGVNRYPVSLVATVAVACTIPLKMVILIVLSLAISHLTAMFILFIIDVALVSILILRRYNQ